MVEDIIQVLRSNERIVIITHVRPDGDAIGSQLALGLFLQRLGKQVRMINAHDIPLNLEWMEGAQQIETFSRQVQQYHAFASAEVIVAVDVNAAHRLGEQLAGLVMNSSARKVLIDHHREPETWFDHQFVREDAAATGVLICELIRAWNHDLLEGPIATALYVAVLTDTGSFRYNTVTPAVHRLVADLLERGCDPPSKVFAAVYQTRSREWLWLVARVMRSFTLRYGGELGYIVVTQRALKELAADYQDTEGFVDYVLSVDGVKVGLVFSETSKGTKVSFRSRNDWAVDGWARAFGGGGHRNAAGAFVQQPVRETIVQVVAAAPKYTGLGKSNKSDALSAEDEAYLNMLTRSL